MGEQTKNSFLRSAIHNESVSYYRGTRKEVARFLPRRYSRVLEIGCGEGGFRNNFGECEYWGVEPVRVAARIAQNRLDKVLAGSYEQMFQQLPDGYFDLIVCNDVIEHMPNHDKFFQSIKQKMSENSCIVGSVPNVRYIGNLFKMIFAKDWEYEDQGVLDRTHLRFFTEKSLRRTLNEHGFVLDELDGINPVEFKWTAIRVVIKSALVFIFGKDTRFLQFAFRLRYKPL